MFYAGMTSSTDIVVQRVWSFYRVWKQKGKPKERPALMCELWKKSKVESGLLGTIECQNCHAVKGTIGSPARFVGNSKDGFTCQYCQNQLQRAGRPRTVEDQERLRALKQLDRKNQVPIICDKCGHQESLQKKSRFVLEDKSPFKIICKVCSHRYKESAKKN